MILKLEINPTNPFGEKSNLCLLEMVETSKRLKFKVNKEKGL
jgi:hypothetical protein